MKIFVYGTLKQGRCRAHVLYGQKLLEKHVKTKPQYTMYSVNGNSTFNFPALVENGSTSIEGELWEISDNLLITLDEIEGYPWLYDRKKVEIEGHEDVIAYFYQMNTSRLKECGSVW